MTKLQGAFIGFGNIAELGHWPSYAASKDAEIIAVMDPSRKRLEAAKALSPALRLYSSVEDLFRAEKIDFVDICTPPSLHAELVMKALAQNCHVLCEKPLTLKPAEYEAISKAVAKSRRTVFTVHNWKYAPIFQKAFSILKEGKIGPVWHVEIFTLRNNVCQGTTGAIDPEDWRRNAAVAGGGILVDHGWHAFYLLLNLVGAEPQKILAKMLKDRKDPESLEEAVQTLVQFPETGGYIHLTWLAKMRRNHVIVQGQQGTLLLDDDRILLTTHDGKREEIAFDAALSVGSHHADWFRTLLPDFIAEIKDPAKRGANFKEAGWCLALTSAAYQSNLQGFKEVEVLFPGRPKSQGALALAPTSTSARKSISPQNPRKFRARA
jgi:predicted dehydrogenase